MSNIVIGILIFLIAGIFLFILYLLFGESVFGKKSKGRVANLSRMMSANKQGIAASAAEQSKLDEVFDKAKKRQVVSSKLTLEKKIRYARWKIPPILFYWLQIIISGVAVFIASLKFDWPIVLASALTGPLFLNWLLTFFINRRFKAFDQDYPAFLLNVVSMLKIGMNVINAVQSAADGLNPESLVREEVQLMVDRLKLGVSEEKSIGVFGEDIYHPEIELFVQAVILSRRLGGNLSDTLDRLASQVRQRQHFRQSAEAAVGLQRGSILIIIGIMVALETYIYFSSPDLIVGSFSDPIGWMIWQSAIIIILLGIYWIRQVTKLKI